MNDTKRATIRRRALGWLLAVGAALLLAAPLGLLLTGNALAQGDGAAPSWNNPRADFWQAVRGGVRGTTTVHGPETNVLIQNGGENWRLLREGPVMQYGTWILLGMLALIVLAFILFGRARLQGGREHQTIERWSLFDRVLHWYTAILFIILALTGLSLLFGRSLLIPYIGKDAFAAYAALAKTLHNYLGPFFAVGLVLELLKWLRHNLPRSIDLIWLLRLGGLLGRGHASAGRLNGGEKIWYWLLFFGGLALIASGLVLDFPIFGQTRADMQLAELVHVACGIILMAVALGHIYIGTLGTEGALEGMVSGHVDTRWAKQHHDLWYEELLARGVKPVRTPDQATGGSAVPPPVSRPSTTG